MHKMKHFTKTFLFLLLITSIETYGQFTSKKNINSEKFGDISDGLPDKDTLITKCVAMGTMTGIGKMALDGKEVSNLKVGHWKEYNSKAILKSEGTYKIGSYTECCYSGFCSRFYHYKTGIWKYYDNKGNLSYELNFVPSKIHFVTNCKGGFDLLFGIVKRIPIKYDHIVTTDTIIKQQKVEFEHEIGTLLMVPLNGILYWE